MWYEILPSAAAVWFFLTLPGISYAVTTYFDCNGKTMRRFWEVDPYDYNLYLRDKRLTGSEYVPQGLETIPDYVPGSNSKTTQTTQ